MLNLFHPFDVDFQKFEDNIGCDGSKIYVDVDKYWDTLGHIEAICDSARIGVSELMKMLSNCTYGDPTPKKLVDTLLKFGDIHQQSIEKFDRDTRVHKPSADRKVLENCCRELQKEMDSGKISYSREKALRLITEYINFRVLHSAATSASAKTERFKPMNGAGWGGLDLASVDFYYEQKSTMRYYTYDDNIQGWNSELLSSLTVPKGYYLWWGDLKQIDLRVFMNSILSQGDSEVKSFMKVYDDKYEAFTRYLFKSLNRQFDYSDFKLNRDKYKTGVLACLYGIKENALVSALDGDTDIAKMLIELFATNKAYQKFSQNVIDSIHLGGGVRIRDYFGVETVIDSRGSHVNPHILNQCINSPNQCGSNSVVVMLANEIIRRFRELGYGKDDVYIYLVRHDELLFAFRKELLDDTWIFDDCSKIHVDDWEPLEMESGIGIYYTEELPELMEAYKSSCIKHKSEYTPGRVGNHVQYTPVRPVVKAVAYSAQTPAEFYSSLFKVQASDDKSALEQIREKSLKSNSHIGEMCKKYLKHRDTITYYDPYIEEWKFDRPLHEVIEINLDVLMYNCTNNGDVYLNKVLVHFVRSDAEEIAKCLARDEKSLAKVLSGDISLQMNPHRRGNFFAR